MKKSILILGTAMFLVAGSFALTSCNNSETKTETEKKAVVAKQVAEYQCPMKCEGDKTYDENVQCPKCGMDLKKLDGHDGHNH